MAAPLRDWLARAIATSGTGRRYALLGVRDLRRARLFADGPWLAYVRRRVRGRVGMAAVNLETGERQSVRPAARVLALVVNRHGSLAWKKSLRDHLVARRRGAEHVARLPGAIAARKRKC